MMSPKTRRNLFVAILVLLLLLLGFLLWWFLKREPPAPVVAEPAPPVSVVAEPDGESISEIRREEEQDARDQTASIQSASKTFTERYGSYSTEAEFANLRDVLTLMSASFAAETEAFIDGATSAAEYYGVTTRVISVSVDATDDVAGTATVTVTTQREEAKQDIQNITVRYQDLRLTFVTEDGAWKVSSATWIR